MHTMRVMAGIAALVTTGAVDRADAQVRYYARQILPGETAGDASTYLLVRIYSPSEDPGEGCGSSRYDPTLGRIALNRVWTLRQTGERCVARSAPSTPVRISRCAAAATATPPTVSCQGGNRGQFTGPWTAFAETNPSPGFGQASRGRETKSVQTLAQAQASAEAACLEMASLGSTHSPYNTCSALGAYRYSGKLWTMTGASDGGFDPSVAANWGPEQGGPRSSRRMEVVVPVAVDDPMATGMSSMCGALVGGFRVQC